MIYQFEWQMNFIGSWFISSVGSQRWWFDMVIFFVIIVMFRDLFLFFHLWEFTNWVVKSGFVVESDEKVIWVIWRILLQPVKPFGVFFKF